MTTRKSWDEYFSDIAKMVSTRATCPRKSCGAVFVRDKIVLSTGYNGAPRGEPHCTDVGCMMEDNHCVRVSHAERNAIYQAARVGVRLEGSTVYVTASPCWHCFIAMAQVGVERIVFPEFYREDRIFEAASRLDIVLDGPSS